MARLLLKLFITAWLVAVSAVDLLYQHISNWLVVPVMFGGLVWQISRSERGHSSSLLFIVIFWTVIFVIWRAHIFGGGDAKFLMALFALFPDERLLLSVCVGVMLISIPLLLGRMAGGLPTSLDGEGRDSRADLFPWKARISWPNRERLESEGQPFVWILALPSVVYVWWLL
ncbi:MAG: prepilin peptidase [Anaerolineales bacterium]